MNTYELEIHLKDSHLASEDHSPIHHHIDCEEIVLETHLGKIINNGILTNDGYNKKYIPGHRINHIDVKILERVQNIIDVSKSIKTALKDD